MLGRPRLRCTHMHAETQLIFVAGAFIVGHILNVFSADTIALLFRVTSSLLAVPFAPSGLIKPSVKRIAC